MRSARRVKKINYLYCLFSIIIFVCLSCFEPINFGSNKTNNPDDGITVNITISDPSNDTTDIQLRPEFNVVFAESLKTNVLGTITLDDPQLELDINNATIYFKTTNIKDDTLVIIPDENNPLLNNKKHTGITIEGLKTAAGEKIAKYSDNNYNFTTTPFLWDMSFNNTGYVTHDDAGGGNGLDCGEAMVIDSYGRILVTGHCWGTGYDMVIWRYNSNGTLDTFFNDVKGGYVTHNGAAGGNGSDYGSSITIDSYGRILVTGRSYNGSNYDMAIWRYSNNGTLDTSFNDVGYITHNNAAGGDVHDYGVSIVIDSYGRILVTGWSWGSSNYDMVIWRYNSNGTLDTSFNSIGYVTHNNAAGGNDAGRSIAIDSYGRILVDGYSDNGSNYDMAIWRYNSNGTLDTSFNGTGYATHNNAAGGNGGDSGSSITIDSYGRILVAGNSSNGSNYDMAIWRYNSNGTLDTSFNSAGYIIHNSAAGGNGDDQGHSITIDSYSRILVAGYSYNGSNDDMAIWRLYNLP